ncbi:MAG: TonB-dependent receptor, partial [Ignavibacteriales bacterium]
MIRKLFFLLISCFSFVFPQTGSIKGNLIDLSGEPAELVNIVLKGTTIGSVADSKGEFLIPDIPPANYILEISHIAYKTKEISVEVTANKVTFVQDILLELKATELGEVIISHKQNKFKNLDSEYITRLNVRNIETPQSYSTTSPELLSEQNITSYTSAIQTIPGGVVSSQDPGGIVGIYLRGFLTNAYIRNGLYSLSHSGGDMQVVERLEVIKGPSSLIYGTSGISYGGLLNIVTKKPFKKKFFDAGLTFGSYNLQRFTGDINIPFNDDNTMLFRLNVVAHSEGSFQDYGFKRSYLLAPSFYYKINNNTEFFFDAELNNSKFSSPTWFIGVGALNVNQIDEIKVDYFKSYVSRDLDFEPTQLNNYYGRLNYSVSEDWKLSANVALADINLNGSNM